MRRPPITAFLTAGACALSIAAPAAAQTPASQAAPSSAGAAGLRYLNWPGRTYRPATAAAAPAQTPAPLPAPAAPSRPPIIPHGGQASTPYAAAPSANLAPRQGLTPASAWIGSQTPAYQPQPVFPAAAPPPYFPPAPAPDAAPWSRTRTRAPAPAPTPVPESAPPAPSPNGYFAETAEMAEAAPPPPPVAPTAPAPRPVMRPAPRPIPAPAPVPVPVPTPAHAVETAPVEAPPETPMETPVEAPVDAPAADPMAPRRDAPIFRLQRPSAQPAPAPAQAAQPQAQAQAQPQTPADVQPAPAADAQSAQGGARYYSVHRQAGRQPDATPLPAPVYLDALPVDLTSMPASTDLAEPPPAPNLIRNANGRIQALPATEDPVLP